MYKILQQASAEDKTYPLPVFTSPDEGDGYL